MHGGYIEARMDGTELASGSWSIVHYNGDCDVDLPTDFSIGPAKAIQLHITSDGKVQIAAHSHIVPQPALLSLGQTLQDILMRRHGTDNIEDSDYRNEDENNKIGSMDTPWTQPSLLNSPPRQCPVELWPGECALRLQYGSTSGDAKPVLLHSWFERMARDIPHRIAIDFLTDLESGTRLQFTYQQVSNSANALASELIRLASASADHREVQIIAVAIGPCPELYVGYLAALKAGFAFCPLPVDAPKERQEALLADLKPVAILTQDKMRIDTALVQVNHYGFSPSAKNTKDGRTWRWFQGAAPTFDISLFEIFWTLSTGSTLCCAPRHLTMQNIDAVLSTLQANITNVTPSFANLISPSVLTGLMVGGETLNARLLQNYAQHNPDISPSKHEVRETCDLPRGIFNGYGPTEVAMYSLAQPHVPVDQRGSVIGSPLATCGILIVEANRHDLIPIPRGGVGELVLTGPQVSTVGYLNRPDETRAAFVDDKKWGRAYRTGDRARIVWNDEGEPVVEFLGRFSDAQVKLSGRRVELGEIESVLASRADGVQQTLSCVWMPQGDSSTNESLGSERVVNLVVVDHTTGLDFATVSANCAEAARQHLPDYMRPFRILEGK
ncbi:hypothetical protein SPBR_04756 [Sporothrix brasiliensis 5110]|uniref:AMP-dependent synthetase/ligase domain-containing protein n=1 Tax=Sporothrix brasiliensis 5110 TaxID=1398154 RepID=A0A0C2ILU4_9PEZI|nr:uncharacterized protein SPBR_04756 [Sporothrix brasiliensis 5110]KIH87980.1 hypothetical protein SPBR_04756 [Sporothrix brasiliensis 5110]